MGEELGAQMRDVNELLRKTENLGETETLQNQFSALKSDLTLLQSKIGNKSKQLKVIFKYVLNDYGFNYYCPLNKQPFNLP